MRLSILPKSKQAWIWTTFSVVVMVFAVIALCATMFGVFPSDYAGMRTKTNRAISSYNAMQSALASYANGAVDATTSNTALSQKAKTYHEATISYQGSTALLSGERALRDKAVEKAYVTFTDKNATYLRSVTMFVAVLPLVHQKEITCTEKALGAMDTGDLSKLVSSYDSAINPCLAVMRQLSVVQDTVAATTGKKAVTYLNDLRNHVQAMQSAYTGTNRSVFESEYQVFLKDVNNFDVNTDISPIMQLGRLGTPSKQLNNLMSVLGQR